MREGARGALDAEGVLAPEVGQRRLVHAADVSATWTPRLPLAAARAMASSSSICWQSPSSTGSRGRISWLFQWVRSRTDSNSGAGGALRSVTAVHLQILLSADQEWQSANAGFRVTNISEDCRRSLALLGLEPTQWRNEGV